MFRVYFALFQAAITIVSMLAAEGSRGIVLKYEQVPILSETSEHAILVLERKV